MAQLIPDARQLKREIYEERGSKRYKSRKRKENNGTGNKFLELPNSVPSSPLSPELILTNDAGEQLLWWWKRKAENWSGNKVLQTSDSFLSLGERKRKSFGKVQLILEKYKVSAVWFGPGWRSKSLVPLNHRKSNDPGPETFKSELRPVWWATSFCPWER